MFLTIAGGIFVGIFGVILMIFLVSLGNVGVNRQVKVGQYRHVKVGHFYR